jgi:hypothetical protein
MSENNEDDTSNTRPVLIHVDKEDWETFKKIAGSRRASSRVRKLIREDLTQHALATTR